MKVFYKYALIIPLVLCNAACGSFDYINQSKFAALNEKSILLQQPVLNDGQLATPDQLAKAKNRILGGFSFTPKGLDENGRTFEPIMFALRREKQSIQAETVLFESKNKNKTFFDSSTLEIGADKKQKGFGLDLTFQF